MLTSKDKTRLANRVMGDIIDLTSIEGRLNFCEGITGGMAYRLEDILQSHRNKIKAQYLGVQYDHLAIIILLQYKSLKWAASAFSSKVHQDE